MPSLASRGATSGPSPRLALRTFESLKPKPGLHPQHETHGPAARDRDLERDLDAAVDADRLTLRIGWGQVYDRPCSTARKVARALSNRGWTGAVTQCPSCPTVP